MVYMELKKEEFSQEFSQENVKKLIAEYKSTSGEDKEMLLFIDNDDKIEITDIESDGRIHISSNGKYGFVALDFKLQPDDIIKLLELVVKKMNRFKTALESIS